VIAQRYLSAWLPRLISSDAAAQAEILNMQNAVHPDRFTEKDTGRLESFSDGVFSIAMTLLVLELKVPPLPKSPTAAALFHDLARQWPSYFAFVTSFATVLIMWINHHGIFRRIRRTNANLLFANGFLLLLVTVVPFPTALVAANLRTPAATAACAVYAGIFVMISAAYGLVLGVARKGGHLLAPGGDAELARRIKHCYAIGVPFYVLAVFAAFFSPALSLAICSGLWLFWTFVSLERGSAFTE
jgi:uncharacterized membrane protein